MEFKVFFVLTFIFAICNATTYTYIPIGGNNLWSNNLNWNPNGVPGAGDIAIVGQTVVYNSGTAIQELILSGGTFYVTEASSFSTTNITSSGTATVYVAAGSSLTVSTYWNFNGGTLTFQNFGTVSLNPRFTGSSTTLSNTGNNTVTFTGSLANIINVDVTLPTGFSFAQVAQTFFSETTSRTVNLNYRETIPSAGWRLDNNNNSPDLNFNNGLVVNGAITSTNNTIAKDFVTLTGIVTINADVTWNVNPVFSGNNGVFFEGTNKLTFQDKDLTISTPLIGGTGSVELNQQQQTNPLQTVSFGQNVQISNNNLNFLGKWYFSSSGNTVSFTTAGKSISQNYTADNTVVNFAASTTLVQSSSLVLQTNNNGRWTFLDSLNVGQSYTWTFEVGFYCSAPAKTFALTGSTQDFNGGIRVYGCTFTSASQINVRGSVTTDGANSTLPTNNIINFPSNIAFTAANQAQSITLSGAWTIPANNVWSISTELIIGGTLTMNTDSSASGSGMLTVTGNAVTFSQNVVGCLLSFYSGTVTLSGTNRVSLNGGIYLRNTYLTGQANIWLGTSTIYLTKGLSTIDNPNFKFKSGISTQLNFDGIGTNPGAQLDITGTNGNRIIESSVNAANKVNVVFRDQIQFNTTLSLSSSSDSSVTFMQVGTSIAGGYDITFSGNFYFNGTTTTLTGQGSYTFSAFSNLYLTGSLNVNGAANNLAPVYLAGNNIIGAVNDLTIGSVVVLQGSVNFLDNDNVQTTATTTVTLQNDRSVFAPWTLGSNVVVSGNLVLRTTNIPNSPGYLQVNGNQVTLSSSFSTNNRFILTNPTTLTSFDGSSYTLSLGDFNPLNSPFYLSHGLTLPALTVQTGILLSLTNGDSVVQNVAFNGNIGGSGSLSLSNIVGTTSSALTFSTLSITLTSVTLVGSGSYAITPTTGSLTFSSFAYAETTATVNAANINAGGSVNIRGFVFNVNPTNFLSGSYNFRDARTVGVNYVANVPLTFNNDVTLSASISGTGSITFVAGVILSASQTISTNPVTFGASSTSLNVISGAFTLTLSGTSVSVLGRVVSGGASVVSSSPSSNAYVHNIVGGGVIPSSWTWSNTVKFGNLNVTGARTLSFPVQLTNGATTTFNDGITFTNTGTFLADPAGTSTLFVENGITTNTNTVLPRTVTVTTSGQNTFNFAGTNVLQLNGTFNCETRLNFATSVTFGYDIASGTTQAINIRNGCFFFGTTQSLIINRQNINVVANSPQNIYFEPALNFGLLPPLSSSLSSGVSTLLLKGNLVVQGRSFSVTGTNIYLDAISITTLQNSTLTGLNPNATLTFVSTTAPWVEPQVSFQVTLNQNINLNGPIRLVGATLGPRANFVGTGQNRVAFVDSLSFLASPVNTYSFSAPLQFYVSSPTTDFIINGASNTFLLNQVPSLFNPFGLAAPNLRLRGTSPTLRFSFTGAVTFGNVWVEASSGVFRVSSGVTFNAGTFTVETNNVFWVDTATVNLENLFFSQTVAGVSSNFVYTVSSATPPTVTVSKYTFYQGNAVIVVNNYVWTSGSVTAITSTNSNTGGQFLSLTGSPGYTFTQTKSGNNIQFSATQNPTVVPFPTQSNGPSPIVSSASFLLFNFALLFTILFFIF